MSFMSHFFIACFVYLLTISYQKKPTNKEQFSILVEHAALEPETLHFSIRYKQYIKRATYNLGRKYFRNKQDIIIFSINTFRPEPDFVVHSRARPQNYLSDWSLSATQLLNRYPAKTTIKELSTKGNSILNYYADQMVDNCRAKSNLALVNTLVPHLSGHRNDRTLGDYCEAALALETPSTQKNWLKEFFIKNNHVPRSNCNL